MGTPFVDRSLDGCRLRQFYVSGISDTDTLATGIPGIVKVMTRTPQATENTSMTLSNGNLNGSTGNTKRVQAIVSTQATGELRFDGTTTTIVMVWSRG